MLLLCCASTYFFATWILPKEARNEKKKSYYNFNGFITFVQTYSTSLLHNGKKHTCTIGSRNKETSNKICSLKSHNNKDKGGENAQIWIRD